MAETVEFASNGSTASGYLAVPEGGTGPGLLVIQEWWGLSQSLKDVCDRLAAAGFVALAPDLYHGELADPEHQEMDKAAELMTALPPDRAGRDMSGAVDFLLGHDAVTGDGVGVVGFCMGGMLTFLIAANRGDKVKAAAKSRVRAAPPRPAPARVSNFRSNGRVIAIGSSTGGVEALITVLSAMPENCPPIVVTQHMPATFTKSFAARLDRMCAPQVSEAEDGQPVRAGHVLIAPGGARHMEIGGGSSPSVRLRETDLVNGHRPSVDVLFHSVAATCGSRAVGLILTGMGKDGAKGLLAMREAGARTFGQDEGSCVVYGMPKAAFEIGAVERQATLNDLSRLVLEACTPAARENA